MDWHYLKDGEYPNFYAEIIVKCADGDVLSTGIPAYDDDDDFYKKHNAVSYFAKDGFKKIDTPSLRWINVVARCYVGDVYDELQDQEKGL